MTKAADTLSYAKSYLDMAQHGLRDALKRSIDNAERLIENIDNGRAVSLCETVDTREATARLVAAQDAYHTLYSSLKHIGLILQWEQLDDELLEAKGARDMLFIIERTTGAPGFDAVVCDREKGENKVLGSSLTVDEAKALLEGANQ